MLAQVLLETDQTWEAVKAADTATQLSPGWPDAWLSLGRAQRNFGEPLLAQASLARALELVPADADAQLRQLLHAELDELAPLAERQRRANEANAGVPTRMCPCHAAPLINLVPRPPRPPP